MSLPTGFRYLKNMALYIHKGLKQSYIKDYGKDLENKYDRAEKKLKEERVFCLDCPDFKTCRGRFWEGCKNRAMAMREMRGGKRNEMLGV
ncbi:unnamed protein product [marine sediment metagenome]|uniref:Uncharacterized protein n=1 Tax=marine sediment metagenome TaxID=412755 RepID=X0Z748_9ZZZZ